MHKQAMILPERVLGEPISLPELRPSDARAAECIVHRATRSPVAEVSFLTQQNVCNLFISLPLLTSLMNNHVAKKGEKKNPNIRTTQSSSAQPGFARSSSEGARRWEVFSSATGRRGAVGQLAWQNHARYSEGNFCWWLQAGSIFGKAC